MCPQVRSEAVAKMSLQDHNAGNAGDQLKHALLAELLMQLPQDEPWAYAETHAGAGAYETPHAEILFDRAQEAAADEAGASYAHLLGLWQRQWGGCAGPGGVRYPGSPALAALSGRVRGEIVLAENDPESIVRLRDTLNRAAGFGNLALQLLEGSFEAHLETLVSAVRLLILVDPYYYQSKAPDGAAGRLGRVHIEQLVAALCGRDAVLMIFCANPPRDRASEGARGEGTWRSLGADLMRFQPSSMRLFRAAGTPHAVLVAGWAQGCPLVAGIPGADGWERSWMAHPPLALRILEETPAVLGASGSAAGASRQEGGRA
jgi:hypothetical protein